MFTAILYVIFLVSVATFGASSYGIGVSQEKKNETAHTTGLVFMVGSLFVMLIMFLLKGLGSGCSTPPAAKA